MITYVLIIVLLLSNGVNETFEVGTYSSSVSCQKEQEELEATLNKVTSIGVESGSLSCIKITSKEWKM